MYPLVRELAATGAPVRVPVAVTCRVLNLARAPYYRWLAAPVTATELAAAYRANALFDAHRDDPEFGHRLLADEARDAGQAMADRTAWRICSSMGWWSAFGKKRAKNGQRPGPAVHDDLCAAVDKHGVVRHDFTADAVNRLWLTDIRAQDCRGQALPVRDQGRLLRTDRGVLDRLANEVPPGSQCARERRGSPGRRRRMRGPQRPRKPVPQPQVPTRADPPRPDRVDGAGGFLRGQRRHGVLLRPAAEERPGPPLLGHPRRAAPGDRDLDRTDLHRRRRQARLGRLTPIEYETIQATQVALAA